MNEKTKSYVEHMLKKLDFSYESNDKANLYYMTCILQTVIDMNEKDRKYFDEHYAFTVDFNMHGYGSISVKLSFSSSGIKIWNEDELKVKRTIDMFINEGITDKKELIDMVADDLANDYAYKNDFDRYQHVDRYDRIYEHFFKYYSKIASKELNIDWNNGQLTEELRNYFNNGHIRGTRKTRNDKGISKIYSYMDSKDVKDIAKHLVLKGISKVTCKMKECKALTRRNISIKAINKELFNIINDEEAKKDINKLRINDYEQIMAAQKN